MKSVEEVELMISLYKINTLKNSNLEIISINKNLCLEHRTFVQSSICMENKILYGDYENPLTDSAQTLSDCSQSYSIALHKIWF